jgi:hypothetical protein
MNLTDFLIVPGWPASANVKAFQTTRLGGVSVAPYDSLNLGDHVGDAPLAVERNRQLLGALLPSEPAWLEQVHGIAVADADSAECLPRADACIARRPGPVCVVMTADCLPVLLCDKAGTVVGASHAGWKGLAAGVIENTVHSMGVAPENLLAWLGPAISQAAFEVGAEVREAFIKADPQAASAFIPSPSQGGGEKYLADIYELARQRLRALGIAEIYGGDRCTYSEPEQFFSYRRDGVTGRQGTFIWLEKQ